MNGLRVNPGLPRSPVSVEMADPALATAELPYSHSRLQQEAHERGYKLVKDVGGGGGGGEAAGGESDGGAVRAFFGRSLRRHRPADVSACHGY